MATKVDWNTKWCLVLFPFLSFSPGILSGIVIIPGTAGGIFLGSYLVKRVDVRQSCKIAAKYCFIFQFIGTWAVLTFLIPGCKTTLLAGISHPYNNNRYSCARQAWCVPRIEGKKQRNRTRTLIEKSRERNSHCCSPSYHTSEGWVEAGRRAGKKRLLYNLKFVF